MTQVRLMNPKARRKTAKRRNPSPAQLKARAAFAAAARARSKSGRPVVVRVSNPAPNPAKRRKARRRNPIPTVAYRRAARRRLSNPININSIFSLVQDAAIQGAGAVAADIAYAQIAKFLPANLQVTPGQVNVGNAVKMLVTAAAGRLLSKATKGLSVKAAVGAITVQARDIVVGMLPPAMTQSLSGARVGYAVPSPVVRGSLRPANRLGAYTPGSVMLNGPARVGAYTPGGMTVNGFTSAREREGVLR